MSSTETHAAEDHGHVLPLRVYLAVFGALMVLTALTTLVAYRDLGLLNTPLALGIACVKSLAVILWFMHVRHSPRLVQIMAAAGFVWLLILFALTLSDVLTRGFLPGWN